MVKEKQFVTSQTFSEAGGASVYPDLEIKGEVEFHLKGWAGYMPADRKYEATMKNILTMILYEANFIGGSKVFNAKIEYAEIGRDGEKGPISIQGTAYGPKQTEEEQYQEASFVMQSYIY
jgi:hypothetical protein